MTTYTHILDLVKEAEPPVDGILSRTLFQDDRIKAAVFGFSGGQALPEHTTAKPAMLFFVKGQATVAWAMTCWRLMPEPGSTRQRA
jgi:hypothetical protein